jgi:hypothetical protein
MDNNILTQPNNQSVPNNIGNGENIQPSEQVEINSMDNVPQMVDGGQVINENDNRLILNWGLIFTFFKE